MSTTDREYLRRHGFLTMVYRDRTFQSLMLLFDADGQHALHDYYLTDRDLSDEQLLAQRRELDAKDSDRDRATDGDFRLLEQTYLDIYFHPHLTDRQRHDLVNQAIDLHNPVEATVPPPDPAHPRRKRYAIEARGVVRANPDLDRLARAIIESALREAAKEREGQGKPANGGDPHDEDA